MKTHYFKAVPIDPEHMKVLRKVIREGPNFFGPNFYADAHRYLTTGAWKPVKINPYLTDMSHWIIRNDKPDTYFYTDELTRKGVFFRQKPKKKRRFKMLNRKKKQIRELEARISDLESATLSQDGTIQELIEILREQTILRGYSKSYPFGAHPEKLNGTSRPRPGGFDTGHFKPHLLDQLEIDFQMLTDFLKVEKVTVPGQVIFRLRKAKVKK